MIALLTTEDWQGIVAVVTAIAAAYGAIRLDLSRQTVAIKRAVKHVKQETHRDLEKIILRVAAVELSISRMMGRDDGGYRYLPPNGGDPEKGHLPPNSGGPNPPLGQG